MRVFRGRLPNFVRVFLSLLVLSVGCGLRLYQCLIIAFLFTLNRGKNKKETNLNCMARQSSPLRRKFMECFINNPALLLLMKHLVIGQR